jgi:hypothetical protein
MSQSIHIGFTGTRHGMTRQQMKCVTQALKTHFTPGASFHHGDCIGSDVQAAEIATKIGYLTVAHPGLNPRDPNSTRTRAFHLSDTILAVRPFLVRDRDIVDAVTIMIATPHTATEIRRSGTWTTVRYARTQQRSLLLYGPDGSSSAASDYRPLLK